MNAFFEEKRINISIAHFGSLFRFKTTGKANMLYYHLLLKGVYIWEGRNCFFSTEHSPEIIQQIEEKIKQSCDHLIDEGIVKQLKPRKNG